MRAALVSAKAASFLHFWCCSTCSHRDPWGVLLIKRYVFEDNYATIASTDDLLFIDNKSLVQKSESVPDWKSHEVIKWPLKKTSSVRSRNVTGTVNLVGYRACWTYPHQIDIAADSPLAIRNDFKRFDGFSNIRLSGSLTGTEISRSIFLHTPSALKIRNENSWLVLPHSNSLGFRPAASLGVLFQLHLLILSTLPLLA